MPPKRAPRKSTFTARKEEKQRLQRDLAALQAQLRLLQGHLPRDGLPPEPHDDTDPSAQRALARSRHVAFAGVRSLLSSHASSRRASAIAEPIHLPRDERARREVLARSSAQRICDARMYMRERCRFVDLSRPHVATEWFEEDDGSMALVQFDVTPFRCAVRDVYDAIGFYAQNVEIYVSERLGNLTLREDDELSERGDARVSQRRIMSATGVGLTIDANVAFFRQYFAEGACADMPQEHAIVGTQPVESDELYPYVPEERVRHDLEGACIILPVETRQGERVTALARASVITRHSSGHPVPEAIQAPLRSLAMQWGNLMLLAVRERVGATATTAPSGSSATASPSASSTMSP